MRTRLVRVRRRPRAVIWAVVFLIAAMALYLKVSMPALRKMREDSGVTAAGQRVTREIKIGALETYLVSFGGYHVENQAKIEGARYVPRGAAGYILDDDMLEVIGAGYAGREQAEKVSSQLAAEEGLSCRVVILGAEEVRLRMTAGNEQIEAFVMGEEALREAAGALGQLAFSIDKGETTAQQAAEVIRTHIGKVSEAHERLTGLAGETDSGVYRSLTSLLEELIDQMEEMTKEKKAMGLSSRLKYCHVDFRVREIEWLNGLGG